MELLTFVTAGSVDDGKSTLIGRLLYETGCVTDDQVQAVAQSSSRMGLADTNLALFTDGLRAEREQGITIDLAYRYFATSRRKFIIADAPGHVQYTRNMVCGASVSDLALLLVDARAGLTEQTRRHAFILSLLGVPHWLVAVNKMDLVDYAQAAFERIRDEFSEFVGRLRVRDLTFIPVSALAGDNIVAPSKQMDWHRGGTVLNHLENVHIGSDRNLIDARFPIQCVLRPRSDQFHDYRGYAGQLASGMLHAGEEVVLLPSGMQTRIETIGLADESILEASAPMSVALTLADDLDVSRGDLICRPGNQPLVTQDIDAMVCWMDGSAEVGTRLLIKHTTRTVRAVVRDITYRIDVNTRHRTPADSLSINDIARVRLRAAQPIMCDDFEHNRATGSFIAIDPSSGRTVAAGMINKGAT